MKAGFAALAFLVTTILSMPAPVPANAEAAAAPPATSASLIPPRSSLLPPPLLPPPSSLLPLNAMRQDLASRLGMSLSRVTVVAFDAVTWPDACLGVYEPGAVCSQVLTPGFLATLAVEALPWLFPYHGVDTYFIPAPFIPHATLTLPLETRQ